MAQNFENAILSEESFFRQFSISSFISFIRLYLFLENLNNLKVLTF